ncbi:MAG: hypothetical protein Q9218_003306 [Villophora microphyllina]
MDRPLAGRSPLIGDNFTVRALLHRQWIMDDTVRNLTGFGIDSDALLPLGDVAPAIELQAVKKGWIQNSVGPDPDQKRSDVAPYAQVVLGPSDTQSDPVCAGGVVWSYTGKIGDAVGVNGEHKFNQDWIDRGYVFGSVSNGVGKGRGGHGIVFADLRGTGRADLIWRNPQDGTLYVWFNDGHGTEMIWNKANEGRVFLEGKCSPNRQRFPDLRGTGRADLVCIVGDDGIDVYWNNYAESCGFMWDGPHRIHNAIPGANSDSIHFLDVDGNGRDDIVIKGPEGELHGILNFGKPKDGSDIYWFDAGQIASGTGTSDLLFGDMNDDGRDDLIIPNTCDGGGYTVFLNVRGLRDRPTWVRQVPMEHTEKWAQQELRIADITGNGLTDYVLVGPQHGGLRLYANNGSADASVIGDGVWFVDLNGDGLDDRILITQDGNISLWLNGQANNEAPLHWNWIPQNDEQPVSTGVNAKREQYRFADIDGDGKADMVIVNLDGSVDAWLNNGADPDTSPHRWVWTEVGRISESVGDAAGVRFADVTGDGKADLIWLDEGSQMTIYRNDYSLDMDGDQKADAIWVHPWDGTTDVWVNKHSDNQRGWVRSDEHAKTISPSHTPFAGDNVLFARIHVPYGRSDYVVVHPQEGSIEVWQNGCKQSGPSTLSTTDNGSGSSSGNDELRKRSPDGASPSAGTVWSANPLISPTTNRPVPVSIPSPQPIQPSVASPIPTKPAETTHTTPPPSSQQGTASTNQPAPTPVLVRTSNPAPSVPSVSTQSQPSSSTQPVIVATSHTTPVVLPPSGQKPLDSSSQPTLIETSRPTPPASTQTAPDPSVQPTPVRTTSQPAPSPLSQKPLDSSKQPVPVSTSQPAPTPLSQKPSDSSKQPVPVSTSQPAAIPTPVKTTRPPPPPSNLPQISSPKALSASSHSSGSSCASSSSGSCVFFIVPIPIITRPPKADNPPPPPPPPTPPPPGIKPPGPPPPGIKPPPGPPPPGIKPPPGPPPPGIKPPPGPPPLPPPPPVIKPPDIKPPPPIKPPTIKPPDIKPPPLPPIKPPTIKPPPNPLDVVAGLIPHDKPKDKPNDKPSDKPNDKPTNKPTPVPPGNKPTAPPPANKPTPVPPQPPGNTINRPPPSMTPPPGQTIPGPPPNGPVPIPNVPTISKPDQKSCTESVVTDFWVSCSTNSAKSIDCKTTSTSVVRGCSVHATTATISGSYCPVISLDPNDDQGEDGTSTPQASSTSKGPSSTDKPLGAPPGFPGGKLFGGSYNPTWDTGSPKGVPGVPLPSGASWASFTKKDMVDLCGAMCNEGKDYPMTKTKDFDDKATNTNVRLSCGVSPFQGKGPSVDKGDCTGQAINLVNGCTEWGGRVAKGAALDFVIFAIRLPKSKKGPATDPKCATKDNGPADIKMDKGNSWASYTKDDMKRVCSDMCGKFPTVSQHKDFDDKATKTTVRIFCDTIDKNVDVKGDECLKATGDLIDGCSEWGGRVTAKTGLDFAVYAQRLPSKSPPPSSSTPPKCATKDNGPEGVHLEKGQSWASYTKDDMLKLCDEMCKGIPPKTLNAAGAGKQKDFDDKATSTKVRLSCAINVGAHSDIDFSHDDCSKATKDLINGCSEWGGTVTVKTNLDLSVWAERLPPDPNQKSPPKPPSGPPPKPDCGTNNGVKDIQLDKGTSWASFDKKDMSALCHDACYSGKNYPVKKTNDFDDKAFGAKVRLVCDARTPAEKKDWHWSQDECFDHFQSGILNTCSEWGGRITFDPIDFVMYAFHLAPDQKDKPQPSPQPPMATNKECGTSSGVKGVKLDKGASWASFTRADMADLCHHLCYDTKSYADQRTKDFDDKNGGPKVRLVCDMAVPKEQDTAKLDIDKNTCVDRFAIGLVNDGACGEWGGTVTYGPYVYTVYAFHFAPDPKKDPPKPADPTNKACGTDKGVKDIELEKGATWASFTKKDMSDLCKDACNGKNYPIVKNKDFDDKAFGSKVRLVCDARAPAGSHWDWNKDACVDHFQNGLIDDKACGVWGGRITYDPIDYVVYAFHLPVDPKNQPKAPPAPVLPTNKVCGSNSGVKDITLETGDTWASFTKKDMSDLCLSACADANNYPVRKTKDFDDKGFGAKVRLVCDASAPSGSHWNWNKDECADRFQNGLIDDKACGVWGGRVTYDPVNFVVYAFHLKPDPKDQPKSMAQPAPVQATNKVCGTSAGVPDIKLDQDTTWASYTLLDMSNLCHDACFGGNNYPIHKWKDFDDKAAKNKVRLVCDANAPKDKHWDWTQQKCFDNFEELINKECKDGWGGRITFDPIEFKVWAFHIDPDPKDEPNPPAPSASTVVQPTGKVCGSNTGIKGITLAKGTTWASFTEQDMKNLCHDACYGGNNYPIHKTKDFDDKGAKNKVRLVCDANAPKGEHWEFTHQKCSDNFGEVMAECSGGWGGKVSYEPIDFTVYAFHFDPDGAQDLDAALGPLHGGAPERREVRMIEG